MNIPINIAIPQETIETRFDQLVLQIVDAFRGLDVALENWINDGGENCANGSTGSRLKTLLEISFSEDVASKPQVSRFRKLSSELAETLQVRNAIIHSEPYFGLVNGIETIFLKPIGYRYGSNMLYLHLTVEDITRSIDKARSTAQTLNSWRHQRDEKKKKVRASSPPPPSLDAAGGP